MMTSTQLVHGIVESVVQLTLVAWSALAAEPILQLLAAAVIAASLLGGGARGRARRAH